jgi:hypothetical protein
VNIKQTLKLLAHNFYLDNGNVKGLSEKEVEELFTRAIIRGYKEAVDDWSVWHNGEKIIGCGVYTYKEVMKELEK